MSAIHDVGRREIGAWARRFQAVVLKRDMFRAGPRSIAAGACAILLMVLAGCPGTMPWIDHHGTVWTNVADESIPGIHVGSVMTFTLQRGQATGQKIFVWTDVAGSRSRSSSNGDSAYAELSYRGAHDAEVKFSCETRDGATVQVKIDETTYDVGTGTLFLISTQGKSPRIAQLSLDIAELPSKAEELRDFALGHEEIAAFFKEAQPAKSVEQ